MSRDESAARLIERVLADPAFRARFRRDPEAAAREAGLEPVEGRAFETLELRESKSSLAGAMLAAAIEGVSVYDYVDHLAGGGVPAVDADDLVAADSTESSDDPYDADDTDGSIEPDDGDAPDSGDADDSDEADDSDAEDEDDEDEDDEDEDEPDEEEPDEVGPDIDDLTDDEVVEDEPDEPDEPDGDDESDGYDESDDGEVVPDLGDVDSEYPGDDAPREQIAAWMAGEAQRRGLPPELPVMAALVESGLQNLPGGHADSMGFFQMRVSIWNGGPYAGYAGRPELQLDWFLDHAEQVGGRVGDGQGYGEWIANVERPAAQYRGRYQERLEEARELLRRARPPIEELIDGAGGDVHPGSHARAALAEARKYLGTAYQWGGSSPRTGFDCSGLVQWAYAEAGIRIPRVTDQQILAEGAVKVSRRDLVPGDLVFFRDATGYVHHVGMSLGGHRFIHAPHTGDVVKVSSLKEPYYAEQFTGGRRFDPAVAEPVDSLADEREVARARVALEHDAAQVERAGTALFRAIEAQEAYKNSHTQVLSAIRPDQVWNG